LSIERAERARRSGQIHRLENESLANALAGLLTPPDSCGALRAVNWRGSTLSSMSALAAGGASGGWNALHSRRLTRHSPSTFLFGNGALSPGIAHNAKLRLSAALGAISWPSSRISRASGAQSRQPSSARSLAPTRSAHHFKIRPAARRSSVANHICALAIGFPNRPRTSNHRGPSGREEADSFPG